MIVFRANVGFVLKEKLFVLFPLLFLIFPSNIEAQSLTDKVHYIEPVKITFVQSFKKEEAGMKEIKLDTSILKKLNHQDLGKILSENTNIYIKSHGRGALATASFRGASASHTQVNWNGININSPMLGMVDFTLIPSFIIDEVSLLYAGASVSNMSGGLGGMIRLSNKPDWSNRFSARYHQGIGQYSTYDEFTQFNIGGAKFQSKTRLYHNYSKNDYEFVNKKLIERDIDGQLYHPIQTNKNASFGKRGVTQEFYYRPDSKSVVSAMLWYQDASRSIPSVHSSENYGESNLLSNVQDDQALRSILSLNSYGDKSKLYISSGIDIQAMNYEVQAMINGLEERRPVNSSSRMNSWSNKLDYRYEYSEKWTFKSKLSFDQRSVSTMDSATNAGFEKKRTEGSIFGGSYYSPLDNLHFAFQLRKDYIEGYKTPLIYTLGFNYKPKQAPTYTLKANFTRNYNHPSLNDLYWQPGGNPDLLPEEGYSGEVSVLHELDEEELKWYSQLTFFHSEINNWILWLPSFKGYWEPVNINKVQSSGVEAQLKLSYTYARTKIFLNGNIAYTSTHKLDSPIDGAREYGNQLPFIPRISGNVFLSLSNRGYFVRYQQNTIGKRYILTSSDLESDHSGQNSNSLYTHYLNKLSFGKEMHLSKVNLSVELNIDNLFNETYRNILQRFMPGRSVYLMLKVGV